MRSARRRGLEVNSRIIRRLRVAEKIFSQQWEMYRRKVNRIAERIVSFHRPYVRPIKRGKQGKEVEFGGKGALAQVDGFLFVDHFAHEAFAEESLTAQHLEAYVERFGKLPPSFTAERKYGTRANRELMGDLEIRESFRPLGRRAKVVWKEDRWFRRKQKERNRIEGSLGHGKEHYGLDRVRYSVKDGSEIWVRTGIWR